MGPADDSVAVPPAMNPLKNCALATEMHPNSKNTNAAILATFAKAQSSPVGFPCRA